MAKIDKSELTREQIQKAMACETAEELMALAKAEGFDITKEEAEATWMSWPTWSWTKQRWPKRRRGSARGSFSRFP